MDMTPCTVAVNQFTAIYLIEFNAEPQWCNQSILLYNKGQMALLYLAVLNQTRSDRQPITVFLDLSRWE